MSISRDTVVLGLFAPAVSLILICHHSVDKDEVSLLLCWEVFCLPPRMIRVFFSLLVSTPHKPLEERKTRAHLGFCGVRISVRGT